MDDFTTFSALLADGMRRADVTAYRLGVLAGVNQGAIRFLLSEERQPLLSTAIRLVRALNACLELRDLPPIDLGIFAELAVDEA